MGNARNRPPGSYNSPSFDLTIIETGPVGYPLEFEPAKSANPTRFLSKIDQSSHLMGRERFLSPPGEKACQSVENHVLFLQR